MDFSEQYHIEGETWEARWDEKSISSKTYKERLKIPEVFRSRSLWELSKGLNIFYEKGPLYSASVTV
jgi:hypothetical protein